MDTKTLGKQGEDYAEAFLRKQGYRILARNFRVAIGELDIVARDGATIVFIEVKTRRGDRCGTPGQSVNWRKQQKIARTADWYLKDRHLEGAPCRFDVMEIYAPSGGPWSARQIKGAFEQ